MKPLVIYHDHCTDGFGAAFCAWLKFGDEAEYVPMNYGFKEENIPKYAGRDVFMFDFSWPKEQMLDLFRLANSYRDWETDRKSTRLNSSHSAKSRMPSSA